MKRNNTDAFKMIAFAIVVFILVQFSSVQSDRMLEMADKQGIEMECHYVTTKDGYILRLYHMLPSANMTTANNRTAFKPMLFMHGLQSSSLDFVFYPNSSVGHYFHNLGYDIWMGNSRGNTFSRNHTSFDPTDAQFWKFSWHEIGIYDLPAIIDFVLEQTEHDQLIYTGHSQGGTAVLVLLSEHPEYNEKIASIHTMAAAVVYTNTNPIVTPLLKNVNTLKSLIEQIELFEVNRFERVSTMVQLFGQLCKLQLLWDICRYAIGLAFGPFAKSNYYNELLQDYSTINPSGSSYMQYIHYLQIYKTGRFQRFDHGISKNMKLYESATPPQYNLSNVQTRLHVMFGTNDNLVSSKGSRMLVEKMKNCTLIVDEIKTFNHLDFVMGQRVHMVNEIMMRAMNKFNNEI